MIRRLSAAYHGRRAASRNVPPGPTKTTLKGTYMRAFALFLFSCAFLLPYSASAAALPGAAETQASENLPPVILAGLQAYKAGCPDNAIAAWVRGSALDGNKEVLSEANMLHSIQGFYG